MIHDIYPYKWCLFIFWPINYDKPDLEIVLWLNLMLPNLIYNSQQSSTKGSHKNYSRHELDNSTETATVCLHSDPAHPPYIVPSNSSPNTPRNEWGHAAPFFQGFFRHHNSCWAEGTNPHLLSKPYASGIVLFVRDLQGPSFSAFSALVACVWEFFTSSGILQTLQQLLSWGHTSTSVWPIRTFWSMFYYCATNGAWLLMIYSFGTVLGTLSVFWGILGACSTGGLEISHAQPTHQDALWACTYTHFCRLRASNCENGRFFSLGGISRGPFDRGPWTSGHLMGVHSFPFLCLGC